MVEISLAELGLRDFTGPGKTTRAQRTFIENLYIIHQPNSHIDRENRTQNFKTGQFLTNWTNLSWLFEGPLNANSNIY